MQQAVKWYHKLGLEMLWYACRAFAILPRWIRYGMAKPFLGLLLWCVRYRRKVILGNLQHSFPERTGREIGNLAWKYYMFLGEVIVDCISMAGANEKHKDEAVLWINAGEMHQALDGRDWIATGAHYGCWEYLPLWSRQQSDSVFMSVYHPLKSVIFELFFQRLRAQSPNIVQVPMKQTVSYYLRHRSQTSGMVLGLLSDQSPVLRADSKWIDFLHQPTIFIDGAEMLAVKFHIPVYFAHTQRVAPGRYEVRLNQLYDGREAVAPHEITGRYARMLESMIKECPELWMWSHNRWKHTPEKQTRLFGKSILTNTD